jgi:hypothetical protein
MHEKVVAEHRTLEALLEKARTAMTVGESARDHFSVLREALEAHLAREESLYYPTIWALRPDLKSPLLQLVESHPPLRAHLDALSSALEGRAQVDPQRCLEEFSELFGAHEEAEEQLLDGLDRELDTVS